MRIDTYLYRIRLARTRGRVQRLLDDGLIRVDGRRITKHSAEVHEGSTLTLPMHGEIRVIRIAVLPPRRGPAAEARTCYEELGKTANDSQQANQR